MTTKHILFLAHAPSDNTRRLRDAVVEALAQPDSAGVDLRVLAPQDAAASDVMPADGLLLLTTENIGYMAGLTKDFFDRSYDDLLEQKPGLPVATLIRAGLDGTATRRALEGIYGAQGWRPISALTILHGGWDEGFIGQAQEAAMALAAGVEAGIF